jgi:hypothetical protein
MKDLKMFLDREHSNHPLGPALTGLVRWKIEANITYAYPTDFEDNGEPKCGEKDNFTTEGPWFFTTNVDVKQILDNSTAIEEYRTSGKRFKFMLDPAPKMEVTISRSSAGSRHDIRAAGASALSSVLLLLLWTL